MLRTKKVPASKLLVRLALESLEGKPMQEGALEKIRSQVGEVPNIYEIYSAILSNLRYYLRNSEGPMSREALNDNLRSAKLPDEYRDELIEALCVPNCPTLSPESANNFYLRLEQLRWRIDITISSSALSRVLEPSIIFEMLLSSGKMQTFEVSITKFHELRYNVASLLKEMETIEKKKIFKKSITSMGQVPVNADG